MESPCFSTCQHRVASSHEVARFAEEDAERDSFAFQCDRWLEEEAGQLESISACRMRCLVKCGLDKCVQDKPLTGTLIQRQCRYHKSTTIWVKDYVDIKQQHCRPICALHGLGCVSLSLCLCFSIHFSLSLSLSLFLTGAPVKARKLKKGTAAWSAF